MYFNTQNSQTGFTLIELLTTLLILAIMLGTVALKAFPNEEKILQEEAQKLALLLEQAGDEALSSRRTLAWSGDQSHYEFWRLDANREWQPFSSSEIFRARTLPANISISSLSINQAPVPPQSRIVFHPSGINTGYRITLTMHQQQTVVSSDSPLPDQTP